MINIKELNLNSKAERLFKDLERNSGVPAAEYINNLINGKNDFDELVALNRVLIRRAKDPNPKTYTTAEVKTKLAI